MIRQIILAAAAFALGGIGIAQAETTFIGVVRATAVTTQCRNAHVGDEFTARFHPYLTSQSDRSEGFSLVYQFGGQSYILRNRGFDATFRTVESGGLGWGGNFAYPIAQTSKIALVGTRPAITTATSTLILRWKTQRPDNDPGGLACVVSYTGAFLKRS